MNVPGPVTAPLSKGSATVRAVSCRQERRPLRAPFRTALREARELEAVRVQVAWSDGSTTAGEVSPVAPVTGETAGSVAAAATGPLADAVRGVALADHEEIFRRLRRALPGNTTAKCALDLAVHAALAEGMGQALYGKEPGAASFQGAAAYLGTALRPVRTDITVSLGTPEGMAAEAAAKVAEGFDVLKLKLGGGDTGQEAARVTAVARAVGPGVALRLDANQAWTAKDALSVLDALERAGVRPELVEQPVPAHDLAGMAIVARNTSVPVLADESVHGPADVVAVAEAGAAELVNIKLAKCGGLRAARDVVAVAEACSLGVIVGCMLEPPSTLAAGALLAMTLQGRHAHDLDAVWWVEGGEDVRLVPPMVVTGL